LILQNKKLAFQNRKDWLRKSVTIKVVKAEQKKWQNSNTIQTWIRGQCYDRYFRLFCGNFLWKNVVFLYNNLYASNSSQLFFSYLFGEIILKIDPIDRRCLRRSRFG
jgi:hypothetical protein